MSCSDVKVIKIYVQLNDKYGLKNTKQFTGFEAVKS